MLFNLNPVSYSGLGARKTSRSISQMTCMVLRKCLPTLPLPLSTLKNPIHFSLPVQQTVTDNTNGSASSSTKTTVSDLSIHMTSTNEKGETEEVDGMSSLQSPVIPSMRLAYLRQGTHSDSDFSDGDCRAGNKCPLVNSEKEKGLCTPDNTYNIAELNTEDLSNKLSSLTSKVDLELFSKFFPEMNDSNERLMYFHFLPLMPTSNSLTTSSSVPSAYNPWVDSDSETRVMKPPVIVPTAVPTAVPTNTDILSGSIEEPGSNGVGGLFKTASNFVEEPAPQVLGHVPSERHELVYSKGISVDRSVCELHSQLYTIATSILKCSISALKNIIYFAF